MAGKSDRHAGRRLANRGVTLSLAIFITGLMIGVFLGIVIMALMFMAREADKS